MEPRLDFYKANPEAIKAWNRFAIAFRKTPA